MTPKEKAVELNEKFITYTETNYCAKQCASIAVDEVLNFIQTDAFSYTNEEYWQEVKTEIEKL